MAFGSWQYGQRLMHHGRAAINNAESFLNYLVLNQIGKVIADSEDFKFKVWDKDEFGGHSVIYIAPMILLFY
mgnify:CR=1 FL=1